MEVHSFPIDRYTVAGPVRPGEGLGGRVRAPETAGTGVVFDFERLAPFEVLLRS